MPLSYGDVLALLTLTLSCVVFATSKRKDDRVQAAHDQLVSDKLDRSLELARDTRDTVRDMSRKLDDHGERITRVEQRVTALEDRVERSERICVGSTD